MEPTNCCLGSDCVYPDCDCDMYMDLEFKEKDMTELTRKVRVTPAYYLLRDDPGKNYGIAACRIFFYVIGPAGAVQWEISTDWYTDATYQHLKRFPPRNERQPEAWDLGYHSREPRYEEQEPMGSCAILDPEPCYYNGSTLNAEKVLEGFRAGGTDWLWPKLEQYYRYIFEDGPSPDFTPEYQKHPDDELTEIDLTPLESNQ